jgi:hypothetical protein
VCAVHCDQIGAPRQYPISTRLQPHYLEEEQEMPNKPTRNKEETSERDKEEIA